MAELYTKDRRILEKRAMEFRPFGVDPRGERVRDVTGVKIRAFIDCLEETVSRTRGAAAGDRAVAELSALLNARAPDAAYHVTPKMLKNVWNSYSYEFMCFLGEFCKELTGDARFAERVGREKFLSAVIQTLGRPFSLRQIYSMFPHFGEKFSSLILGVESVTDCTAVLTMRYPESIYRQFGPYRYACAEMVCQSAKGALAMVPSHIHHMKPAVIRDRLCVANGDDRCEWELTWEPQRSRWLATVAGAGGAVALAAALHWWQPAFSLGQSLLLALPVLLAGWLADRLFSLRARVKAREDLIQEQLRTVEARHEELREAYLKQEETTVQLREKIAQLTTLQKEIEELNVGLEKKVRERTLDLEKADQLRSLFLSHVSHELRTPLTAIKGFLENLLSGVAGPVSEKHEAYLSRMSVNADRLIRMIGDLLDRTRVETGRLDLALGDVELTRAVSEVIDHLRPLAAEKRQVLTIEAPAEPIIVSADGDRLAQIVTNLVHNAIKFTPEEGRIHVAVGRESPQFAIVRVSDTGPGIPAEAIHQIFDPFFRLTTPQQEKQKGLGLGLSIAKALVSQHGGRIAASSRDGGGAEFSFTLPVAQPVAPARAAPSAGPKRLLVVDDDADIRQMLTDRLSAAGYAVMTEPDGESALKAFARGAFDGLLLDIGMPDLDGLQVLQRIRQTNAAVPVIIITASGSKERALKAVGMGAQDYVLKPFDAGRLQEIVTRWFGPAET